MVKWILVADSSDARLFKLEKTGRNISFLREIPNPKGRLKESELRTDRPGRVASRGAIGSVSAIDPHTSAPEVEAKRFASELAEQLQAAHQRKEFDQLTLIAPPHFLGLLRNELPQALGKSTSLDKDLTHLTTAQAIDRLKELAEQSSL